MESQSVCSFDSDKEREDSGRTAQVNLRERDADMTGLENLTGRQMCENQEGLRRQAEHMLDLIQSQHAIVHPFSVDHIADKMLRDAYCMFMSPKARNEFNGARARAKEVRDAAQKALLINISCQTQILNEMSRRSS